MFITARVAASVRRNISLSRSRLRSSDLCSNPERIRSISRSPASVDHQSGLSSSQGVLGRGRDLG
jgi:hypothetical protein